MGCWAGKTTVAILLAQRWLRALHNAIQQWNAAGENVALACSALKRGYREQLSIGPVRFAYLKGSYDLILRLQARRGTLRFGKHS